MLYVARYLIELQAGHWLFAYFYRTQVRSLATLVSNLLTNWLTFSRLDWCGPGVWRCQLKLVEVVTVANVDNEDRVGNSLMQIWMPMFGHKAKLLFRLSAQGLVKILKLKLRLDLKLIFGQYYVFLFTLTSVVFGGIVSHFAFIHCESLLKQWPMLGSFSGIFKIRALNASVRLTFLSIS